MSLKTFFSEQARNPSGLFGRVVMSAIFDRGNSIINGLMEEKLAVNENERILEIGFGTGKLICKIAKRLTGGTIEGIDLSPTMVAIAQKRNLKHIKEGKVIVRQGDFGEAEYRESSFDKICSANTIYFWSNPVNYIDKIYRILKPGGDLILAFEDKAQLEMRSLSKNVFKFYSLDEIGNLLSHNGFPGSIKYASREKESQIFHCVVATKMPSRSERGNHE